VRSIGLMALKLKIPISATVIAATTPLRERTRSSSAVHFRVLASHAIIHNSQFARSFQITRDALLALPAYVKISPKGIPATNEIYARSALDALHPRRGPLKSEHTERADRAVPCSWTNFRDRGGKTCSGYGTNGLDRLRDSKAVDGISACARFADHKTRFHDDNARTARFAARARDYRSIVSPGKIFAIWKAAGFRWNRHFLSLSPFLFARALYVFIPLHYYFIVRQAVSTYT